VLSGLGPRSNSEAGIATQGTRVIAAAMQAAGARRIIVVSAAPIGTVPSPGRPKPPKHDPGDGFYIGTWAPPLTRPRSASIYADLAQMEDVLRNSDLDWTAVRPPRLTDKPADRHLPDGPRAKPPARPLHFTRRRRPLHALRTRATRDGQANHRHRQLMDRANGAGHARQAVRRYRTPDPRAVASCGKLL